MERSGTVVIRSSPWSGSGEGALSGTTSIPERRIASRKASSNQNWLCRTGITASIGIASAPISPVTVTLSSSRSSA